MTNILFVYIECLRLNEHARTKEAITEVASTNPFNGSMPAAIFLMLNIFRFIVCFFLVR